MKTVSLNEDVNQRLNSHEDMQILRKLSRYIALDSTKQEGNNGRGLVY